MSVLIALLIVFYALGAFMSLAVGLIAYGIYYDSNDDDLRVCLRLIKYCLVWPILLRGPLARLTKDLREKV